MCLSIRPLGKADNYGLAPIPSSFIEILAPNSTISVKQKLICMFESLEQATSDYLPKGWRNLFSTFKADPNYFKICVTFYVN